MLSTLLLCFALQPAPAFGLKVPEGFQVELFSDQTQANDIYHMTLDPKGRVVVTSRGWVKRLEDTKGTGKCDKVTVLMETKTGGMGMLFVDGYFYFTGDGWVTRYKYDGEKIDLASAKRLIPTKFTEHGGHNLRKGPDGFIYLIGGNDSEFPKYGSEYIHPDSPIKKMEGGGILKLDPKTDKWLIVAHGFRNPYDFDFTADGDIITWDSDTERDYLLPWYVPTRIFQVMIGGHHGWRLPGYQNALARRNYYPDVVPIAVDMGRASPTGVLRYRGDQFHAIYSNNFFVCDWTFGKIYSLSKTPNPSYAPRSQIFAESIGETGFAPTAICEDSKGSLLVSTGGRGTRGAVYRISLVVKRNDFSGGFGGPKLDHWERLQEIQKRSEKTKEELSAALQSALGKANDFYTTAFAIFRKQDTSLYPKIRELMPNGSFYGNLDLLRCIMLLGNDWNILGPCPDGDVFRPYTLTDSLEKPEKLCEMAQPLLKDSDKIVRIEAARVLAMLEDSDPKTLETICGFLTDKSDPTDDIHNLICIARLKAPPTEQQTQQVSHALVSLDAKFQGKQLGVKQNFASRLGEMVALLVKKNPLLERALLKEEAFFTPANVSYAKYFAASTQQEAGKLFLEKVRKDKDYTITPELVELWTEFPIREIRPLLVSAWKNFSVRDAIVLRLAKDPSSEDRDYFIIGVESLNPTVTKVALNALSKLTVKLEPPQLASILRAIRANETAKGKNPLAADGLAMFIAQTQAKTNTLLEAEKWFHEKYPNVPLGLDEDDPVFWKELYPKVAWDSGDSARGAKLFETRGCATCHMGTSRLGPDLAGVTKRFSRDDLFVAITQPSKDVAPAYRMEQIETEDGRRIAGLVAFESADGLILQTDATTTVRIASSAIASRRTSLKSPMPSGLMKDLKPGDIADLWAYLKK